MTSIISLLQSDYLKVSIPLRNHFKKRKMIKQVIRLKRMSSVELKIKVRTKKMLICLYKYNGRIEHPK